MIIKLSNEDLKKCQDFANAVLKTNQGCYGARGQGNADAIVQQIIVGKSAEVAVYHALKRKYPSILPVDWQIYESNHKSYAPDLIATNLNGHTKSQDAVSAKKYGLSWLFQKTDPLVEKPCDKDYLILCLVKDQTVDILGKVQANRLKGRWGEPKLPHLKENKVALYFDQIKDLMEPI